MISLVAESGLDTLYIGIELHSKRTGRQGEREQGEVAQCDVVQGGAEYLCSQIKPVGSYTLCICI